MAEAKKLLAHERTDLTSRSKRTFISMGMRNVEAWRIGVAWSSIAGTIVLALNIALLAWSTATYGTRDGIGVGFSGDCKAVSVWATSMKVVINILGSILLSVSSYTMQCMSAPTRRDVNRAHEMGDWLDIGISGVRNVFRIRKYRAFIWVLLALSSVPIHLLYNSTIFKTLSTNVYDVVVVNHDFIAGKEFAHQYWPSNPDFNGATAISMTPTEVNQVSEIQEHFQQNTTTIFRNLSSVDCLEQYGSTTVAAYSNVLVLTNFRGSKENDSVLFYNTVDYADTGVLPFAWICHDQAAVKNGGGANFCNIPHLKAHTSEWQIDGQQVEYCLAQETTQRCELQFSIYILIAVIVCNAVKCVAMLLAVWGHKDAILVTVGDAIASFLEESDDKTQGMCLIGVKDIRKESWNLSKRHRWDAETPSPKALTTAKKRWFAGASKKRWFSTIIFFLICIILVAVFLGVGLHGFEHMTGELSPAWSVGFGAVDMRTFIPTALPQQGASGLAAAVLVSNLPQALLSFIYLTYNGLFTGMLEAAEWNAYAQKRHPLRVSQPRGQQLSSRFLTLPYRYSLPLLFLSTTLHWLVSNALYLVRLVVYHDGIPVQGILGTHASHLAYSPSAMVTVISVGVVMVAVVLWFGARKLRGSMPVVGSCSVAISAACHATKADTDAATLPLMWGEVSDTTEEHGTVGHCAFSSGEVAEPKEGQLYAGLSKRTRMRLEAHPEM